MKSIVLGKTTENTQMKFYQEDKILGAKIGQEIPEKRRLNLTRIFLAALEKADRFIFFR